MMPTMAEIKTRPTEASVAEYLDAVTPVARREDGRAVAELMREVTGADPVMWGPSMVGYGSYHYRSPSNPKNHGSWPRVAFSARKAALTFYGLKDRPEAAELLPELGPYTEGAGCLYAARLSDLDEGVLRRLVAIAFARPDDD